MLSFIKKYKKTITFIIVVVLILLGIFAYRQYKEHHGEYEPNGEVQSKEIIQYDANEYVIYRIENIDVYVSYYRDFMNLLINDTQRAYNKLTDETKEDMFSNNYDNFVKYVKSLDKELLRDATVDRYNDDRDGEIIIVDSTEASYVFHENGVWNYKVELNNRILI